MSESWGDPVESPEEKSFYTELERKNERIEALEAENEALTAERDYFLGEIQFLMTRLDSTVHEASMEFSESERGRKLLDAWLPYVEEYPMSDEEIERIVKFAISGDRK